MSEKPKQIDAGEIAKGRTGDAARPSQPFTRSLAQLLTVVALSVSFVTLAVGAWWWYGRPKAEPPVLDLTHVDEEVAETITEARQEVMHKPFSEEAWGRLGMVLRAHDFGVQANICLAQAERLNPHEPRWPYLQGLGLLLSEPGAGITCLQRAVERCGDRPMAPRLRLAEALLDAGRLNEADDQLGRGLVLEESRTDWQSVLQDSVRLRLDLGRLAVLREQWPAALEHLTACAADSHARKLASTMRAQVYRHIGDQRHAEADEAQAGKLPEDERWPDPFVDEVLRLQRGLSARMTNAEALRRSGKVEAAIDLLGDTARKYTASSLPWLTLADLWREMGRMDRAEQACRQAVKADPDAAQAWFGLGSFQAPSHPREAAENFRRAIRLKPDHAVAHFNLGYCLRQLGDLAGAAEEFRQSLRCRPDFAPALAALQETAGKSPERKVKSAEGLSK